MQVLRVATVIALATLALMGAATPANAALAITYPLAANLGSAPIGSKTISAQLGTVTVAGSAAGASFRVTVSATPFTSNSGSTDATIGLGSIFYWSGPATGATGANVTPGQANASHAMDLTQPRTAMAGSARGVATSVSWNPTLIIKIPDEAVAGAYSASITHSVA